MALAAVFVEGIIFFVISVAGLRVKIAKMFPECVKIATTGGIGFFLAHLGLQTAEGIGLVVADVATGITIGGCPPANRTYAVFDRFAYDVYLYECLPFFVCNRVAPHVLLPRVSPVFFDGVLSSSLEIADGKLSSVHCQGRRQRRNLWLQRHGGHLQALAGRYCRFLHV
jgi:hypothetical protein